MLDFMLESGRQSGTFGDEEPVETVIAGKSVQSFDSPIGRSHVYPGGEVLWVIQGSDSLAADWLTLLP